MGSVLKQSFDQAFLSFVDGVSFPDFLHHTHDDDIDVRIFLQPDGPSYLLLELAGVI